MNERVEWIVGFVPCSLVLRNAGVQVKSMRADSPVTGKKRAISLFDRDTRWKDYSCPDAHAPNGFKGGDVISLYAHIYDIPMDTATNMLWQQYHGGSNDEMTAVSRKVAAKETCEAPTLSKEELDAAYKIFLNLCVLDGKGEEYLHSRKLTDAEIAEIGFKTFPSTAICKVLTRQLRSAGIDPDSVPGLYTRKGDIYCSFDERDALIIPVREANGLIRGLQLRSFDPNAELRYMWFSSSGKTTENCIHDGKGSGSPVCFISGRTQYKTAFITEGVFKALAVKKKFGCPGFAVQGVGNIKGLDVGLAKMLEQYQNVQRIVIAYDADFICKMQVSLQAVRLYDMISETFPQLVVDYLLWDMKLGKGIDDLFNANPHAERLIKSIPMKTFKLAFDEFYSVGVAMKADGKSEEEIGTAFKAVLDKYINK